MPAGLPSIWIVTLPEHPSGPVEPLRRALSTAPGARVGVQLRAKQVDDRQLIEWGRELRTITAEAGCAMTVNGRADVAEIVEADGVHLPERGLPIDEVRQQWPAFRWVGVSRHDRAGLEEAEAHGADYAFLSPVFAVPGKGAPLGPIGFAEAIAPVGIPSYALGGVTVPDVGPLRRAGGFGVALRRAIYDDPEPGEALGRMIVALDKSGAAEE